MKKIISNLIFLMGIVMLTSCEQSYDQEYNWAYPVSGQWRVNLYEDDEVVDGPYEIQTYNSSFGQEDIWIDDYPVYNALKKQYFGNYWTFQVKAKVDMKTRTFTAIKSQSIVPDYTDLRMNVDGKIVGNDSIVVKLEFSDDAGTIYEFRGRRSEYHDDYEGL